MLNKSIIDKHHFSIFLLLMIVMSALMILIYRPFAGGHDFCFHFNRFIILMDALKNGDFPFYMDHRIMEGYGYPIKLFYSDLLLVPYALIANITSAIVGYQLYIFTNTILCALFAQMAFKRITKNSYASYIGSLLYTFAAYRMYDIYIRSAVGEVLALTFLPLVLLGIYEIIYGNYKKWYILAIGISLVIYSHIITSLLVFVFVALFLLFNIKKLCKEYQRLCYLAVAALVSCLFTAYYALPMIEQFASNTFYVQVADLKYSMTIFNLYSLIYGFFSIFFIHYEGLYPSVGIIIIAPLILRLFIKEKSTTLQFVDTLSVTGILLVLFTTFIYPWHVFPFSLLDFVQFSWRLNIISTLLLSFSAGYYIAIFSRKKILFIVLIIAVHMAFMIVHAEYFKFENENVTKYLEYDNFKTEYNDLPRSGISGGEYLPSRITEPYHTTIQNRGNRVIPQQASTTIAHFTKDKGHITFDVEVSEDDKLELPLTYYVGYEATLDGAPLPYQQSELGLIEVPVSKSGKVEVVYMGTTLQKVSYYITIISMLLFTIFIIANKRKNKPLKQQ